MMIRIRFVCQNNIHGTKSEDHNSYSSIDNNKRRKHTHTLMQAIKITVVYKS